MKTKKCKKCKSIKNSTQFSKDKHSADGRKDVCISCRHEIKAGIEIDIPVKYLVRGL